MEDSRPTVQRTLVKSPPELWADLSDPETLSRRLGDFGEIRITRLVPETTVAWEGERASGTVEIEPSGWGTKVRLSAAAVEPVSGPAAATDEDVEHEAAVDAALRAEIEREAAIEAALRVEVEREAEAAAAAETERSRRAQAEAARQLLQASLDAQDADGVQGPRGLFSRLRKRRRHEHVALEVQAASAAGEPSFAGDAVPQSPAPAARPTTEPSMPTAPARPAVRQPVRLSALAFARANPTGPAPAPPVTTAAADFDKPGAETITASRRARSETRAKPALDDEQTLAVLASVLDDLGSAHHRPFSRE
jgi:hypothetical protein